MKNNTTTRNDQWRIGIHNVSNTATHDVLNKCKITVGNTQVKIEGQLTFTQDSDGINTAACSTLDASIRYLNPTHDCPSLTVFIQSNNTCLTYHGATRVVIKSNNHVEEYATE